VPRPALALLLLLALPVAAQTEEGSPRETVRHFREAAARGRWNDAAALLAPAATGDRLRLARELAAVLDARTRLDLDKLSDAPTGRLDDQLPPDVEEIATLRHESSDGHVRLSRLSDGRWVFSASTLSQVPAWYGSLEHGWIREHLPEPLLRRGWRGLAWWQWLALPGVSLLSWLLGSFLAALLRRLLRRLARRTSSTFDDLLVEQLRGPSILFGAAFSATLVLPFLVDTEEGAAFTSAVVRALYLAATYWAALRAVDLAADWARQSEFVRANPESQGLLPLGSRVAKVALGLVAVVTVLQQLGYPAASLIAGLGIGGLAFALAAQKTIENLFGGVTLGLDQPFRPGDFVKVEDFTGTVESVGLRSTRIRTLDRTLITVPNGRLADMRIETFDARDRFRFFTLVGLTYGTPAAALEAIVRDIRALLDAHPRRSPSAESSVCFQALGASSLDIEVMGWFEVKDAADFKPIRQELLLGILAIVERHGAAVAFPTQTHHVFGPPGRGEKT
jgi:MscS family membrane protein